MRGRIKAYRVLVGSLLLLPWFAPLAGPGILHGSVGDNGGAHVDLVVRKITVTPVRAHVGDVVRIEMEWEYWGDLVNNYYDTTFAEVSANDRVIARKPFDYRFGAFLGDVSRETFLWDTKDAAPGTYRIRGEVPLRLDATPYDNFLVVKEPVILIPERTSIPAGEGKGGSAAAENRFWVDR